KHDRVALETNRPRHQKPRLDNRRQGKFEMLWRRVLNALGDCGLKGQGGLLLLLNDARDSREARCRTAKRYRHASASCVSNGRNPQDYGAGKLGGCVSVSAFPCGLGSASSRCLGPEFASHLLIIFGLLSMGIAVPFILVQRSFRRLLAYSSIDHGGIMILGLAFGGPLGALGMLLHMTFHTVTKPLLFFSAGNVQQHLKTDQ